MKWEYKTVTIDEGFRLLLDGWSKYFSEVSALNVIGQDRWEMVAIQKNLYYFKRQIIR